MKTLTLFLTLTFILSANLSTFADGFESASPASCNGNWNGTWPWQKSKPTITEYWEWKDLSSMNPYLGQSNKEDKPAKIYGFVGTYQATRGRGTVGVTANGEVDDYVLGFMWKIKGVSGDDSTYKSTTGTKYTTTEGSYALSGSGEVMGTSGGGSVGVTITGTGGTLRGSGNITISGGVPYVAPPPLVATKVRDLPPAYECAHEKCEVALPDKHHHRHTCKEKVHFALGSVVKVDCNRKYYRCQRSTCPNEDKHIIPHACGHEDEKEDAWKHALQSSCSISMTRDGITIYCQSTNYFLCQHKHHEWPPVSNPPSGGGSNPPSGSNPGSPSTPSTPPSSPSLVECGHRNCTEMVSSPTDHRQPCGSGQHYYWPGCPNNTNWWSRDSTHALKSCRRAGCTNTWRRCLTPTPSCPISGTKCWAQ